MVLSVICNFLYKRRKNKKIRIKLSYFKEKRLQCTRCDIIKLRHNTGKKGCTTLTDLLCAETC